MTYMLYLVLIFLAGFLMHALKAANDSVKAGTTKTIGGWFVCYWSTLVIRLSLLTAFFVLYNTNLPLASKAFQFVGISISTALPITHTTSFMIGYFADSLLDMFVSMTASKIPWFAKNIPSYAVLALADTNK